VRGLPAIASVGDGPAIPVLKKIVDARHKALHDEILRRRILSSLGYFLVQCPNMANEEGVLEMPPVSEPSSSEIVAFHIS